MKPNVFIFHGTGGHPEENWFPWLRENLEVKGYKVIVPQFPTPEEQSAESWFNVLDNYKEYINEDTIFVGHSLGGIFLLRVLEQLPHKIKAAFFTGTPIGVRPILNYDGDEKFSGFSFDWKNISNKSYNFFVYHSDDDPYVCLENGRELAKNLGIELTFIPNAGHFNRKAGYITFPDILEKIEKIDFS